ncbi:MAG: NUDIX hydrolase [bacterium]
MEKTLLSRKIFSGKIINLRVDEVELSHGKRATREIVEHPGAVAIVALTDKKEIVLIRQYRKAPDEDMWEIPAGKLEPGEDPRQCAIRELWEETGFRAASWEKVFSFYTSPGFSNEIVHLYLARELQAGEQHLEADEEINIRVMPFAEALAKLSAGEIRDGKTIIGLFLWAKLEGN